MSGKIKCGAFCNAYMGVDRYKNVGETKIDFHFADFRTILLKIAKDSFTGVIVNK